MVDIPSYTAGAPIIDAKTVQPLIDFVFECPVKGLGSAQPGPAEIIVDFKNQGPDVAINEFAVVKNEVKAGEL
jgi:hypothetical protein